jgi:outer membrane protein OmpA-like peptidoglycan-associated protein
MAKKSTSLLLAAFGVSLVLAATTFIVGDASAQQQLRQQRSGVVVDWSVLDEMARGGVATGRPQRLAEPEASRAPRRTARRASPAPRSLAQAPRSSGRISQAIAPAGDVQLRPPPPPTVMPEQTAAVPVTQPPPVSDSASASPAPAPAAVVSDAPPAPSVSAPAGGTTTSEPAPAVSGAPSPAPGTDSTGTQVAALPSARPAGPPPNARVAFAGDSGELNDSGKGELRSVIDQMKRQGDARLRIEGYAIGGDDGGTRARRLSLSRALAIRAYLMDQGIASTRMDVYARGNQTPEGTAADRVDLTVVRR